ncbi:MAG: hypothetical protein EOO10_00145 [Chitinophagaceae bacterium]|nr:MAG: hypothetical protein EOO10_00145 [Chitinophagaceae bacterium]
MLNHLTNYLFQYRSVSIPHVGTIQLVQHPPQLNVVDKLMLPPSYSLELKTGGEVSDHQLAYFNAILQKGKDDVLQDLRFFGDKLQEKINGPGFNWEGVGTITHSTQSLPLSINALEPVPAQRVIRQDARHKVLVGDQQMLSGPATETSIEKTVGKRSIYLTIGWIVLVLSLLVIAFLLYQGKFRINSTGSKQTPTVFHFRQQEKAFT